MLEDVIYQSIAANITCTYLDVSGDGRHFDAVVVSDDFLGKSRLERHRLIYLAGIFFSINHLHGVWRYVAQLDPFLYIIDGFRYGFIAHADYNVITGAVFVAVFALIINIIGYILIKKGVRIKH